jgi:hypothetical protein
MSGKKYNLNLSPTIKGRPVARTLVLPVEYARMAGVSRSAMTKLKKGRLKNAYVKDKVDINHSDALDYLVEKKNEGEEARKKYSPHKESTVFPGSKGSTKKPPSSSSNTLPVLDKEYQDYTLREIALRFASLPQFQDHIKTLKTIASFNLQEQRLRQERGKLISAKLVNDNVFALLDLTFERLVQEVPKGLAVTILSLARLNKENSMQEIAKKIRETNSQVLLDCKNKVKTKLKEFNDELK